MQYIKKYMEKNEIDKITIPITFVITDKGIKKIDYKSIRNYFNDRMKLLGE